ncbi:hypothetical protein NQ626_18290, partial [Acinetobacter baumannii]|nr:hypothetical protein [Acinetobacter baumannii]
NNAVVYKAIWGACISVVGVAIASNAIPWAKILKVKKAAKAVGGIRVVDKKDGSSLHFSFCLNTIETTA